MSLFKAVVAALCLVALLSPAAQAGLDWEELYLAVHESGYRYRATGELKDPGEREYGPYGAHNLFDKNPGTCWAEGKPGPGLGEAVYVGVNRGERTINLMNGYHKSRDLFQKNNRVSKLNLSVYVAVFRMDRTTELFDAYDLAKFGPTLAIDLPDGMETRTISFPWDWADLEAFMSEAYDAHPASQEMGDAPDDLARQYVLKFEIAGVYPGSKFDDTCISEIWMSR
jgi:hypothetical protein